MVDDSHKEQLREELARLHSLLEQVDESDATLDAETRASLHVVARDMHRVLDGDATPADWPSLGERWREAILDFESQHPRMAQVVEQITSMLARSGI